MLSKSVHNLYDNMIRYDNIKFMFVCKMCGLSSPVSNSFTEVSISSKDI